MLLWVRVGDAGECESFDSLDGAIDYLNGLRVGKVTSHHGISFDTPNFHGDDCISIYWGDLKGALSSMITVNERQTLSEHLEENYL